MQYRALCTTKCYINSVYALSLKKAVETNLNENKFRFSEEAFTFLQRLQKVIDADHTRGRSIISRLTIGLTIRLTINSEEHSGFTTMS